MINLDFFLQESVNCTKILDLKGLQKTLANYDETKPSEFPKYMLKLIIVSCIANIRKQNPVFSIEDEECIQQYLLADGAWYHFEYLVYSNLCHSLSNRVNDRLLRHMLKKYREFHLPSYDEAFFGAFYNISARYLQDADYKRASAMLNMVKEFPVKHTALYLRHHVTFVRLVVSIFEDQNQAAKTNLTLLLRATEMIDQSLYKMNLEWLEALGLEPESLLNNNA